MAPRRVITGPKDAPNRLARSCYDHVAGRLGVAITGQLQRESGIVFDEDCGTVAPRIAHALGPLGEGMPPHHRLAQLPPLPGLERRRPHLAGKLGRWIRAQCLDRGWLVRKSASRALNITPLGEHQYRSWLVAEAWQAVQMPV